MTHEISPQHAIFGHLGAHLSMEESIVLDIFDKFLPRSWEIYVHPHLNGIRPDFVLLNPNVGIALFEVEECAWTTDDCNEEKIKFAQNTLNKIRLYKKELYEIYCPRLGGANDDSHAAWAVITTGVICPNLDKSSIIKYFYNNLDDVERKYQYFMVSGYDEVTAKNLRKIFPESYRSHSYIMREEYAQDLRAWLVEPDFSRIQRTPLPLSRIQKDLASTRTKSGYRRIKGAAGSGKTVVLAKRAAILAAEGKKVLICTFNITLLNYIYDLVIRGFDGKKGLFNIEFVHFHRWCRLVCYQYGYSNEYLNIWRDESVALDKKINEILPNLTYIVIENNEFSKYDAILVDEGQDFQPLWWTVLRAACKQDGEMLLVADQTQDIYGTASSWTDEAMEGMGFRGDWVKLPFSYRLPPDALKIAQDFIRRFYSEKQFEFPVDDRNSLPDMWPCQLRWIQCSPERRGEACFIAVRDMMKACGEKSRAAIPDIVVLSETVECGRDIICELSKRNIKTIDTFDENAQNQRRKKMGFCMGKSVVKATTLHSFKGWEARFIVLCIISSTEKNISLLYTGITRVRRHEKGSYMTVVCCDDSLAEFGKGWPDFSLIR